MRCSAIGSGCGERAGSFSLREMMPRVPRLAASRPSSDQSWRAKATVEVLPPVPVTAAMHCGWLPKKRAAS